jgi:hypothetical protein
VTKGLVNLLFDELFGWISGIAYTVLNKFEYSAPILCGEEYVMVCLRGSDDGRKIKESGKMFDSRGVIVATAESLLIRIPEQDISQGMRELQTQIAKL